MGEKEKTTVEVPEAKQVLADIESNKVQESNTTKKTSKKAILIVIIFVVAFLLIIVGVVCLNISRNNKRVIATGITDLTSKFDKMLEVDKDLKLSKNYTISGNVKLNVESSYMDTLASIDEYKPYVNLINNLGKIDSEFSFQQNLDSKKVLGRVSSKLNNEELIDAKLYIEKDRAYYFVKGFLDKYVDGGKTDYLDTIKENQNTYENIDYLYKFIINSLKSNLKDEYFTKTSEKLTIDGKTIDTKKVTLKLDSKNGNELKNNIISDLKKDEKASKIIKGYDIKLEKSENEEVISDNEEMTFSVYADNISYNILRYDISIKDSENNILVTYLDKETDVIEIYSDNEKQSTIKINDKNNIYDFDILDNNDKKVADLTYTNQKNKKEFSYNLSLDGTTVNGKILSNTTNVVKNKSYDNKIIITANMKSNGTDLGKVKLEMTSKAKSESNINEDVTNAVTEDEITADQSDALMDIVTGALTKLMA